MSIEKFADRIKKTGVLYVNVYPYFISCDDVIHYLIFQRKGDVMLENSWQPICGKILVNESIRKAFIRQVIKRTGQKPINLHSLDFVNVYYDNYYDTVMFVPCAAAQMANKQVKLDKEYHINSKWVTCKKAKQILVWPNQIKCIEEIQQKISCSFGFSSFKKLDVCSGL